MTIMSWRPWNVCLRYLNMGSTWSGPVAYLQKHGWPNIGMPASDEIFCSCTVKFLKYRAGGYKVWYSFNKFHPFSVRNGKVSIK